MAAAAAPRRPGGERRVQSGERIGDRVAAEERSVRVGDRVGEAGVHAGVVATLDRANVDTMI